MPIEVKNATNGEPIVQQPRPLVKVSQDFVFDDLLILLQGNLLALRISNYYAKQEIHLIGQALIRQNDLERYLRGSDVGVRRTGMTFFETNGSVEMLEHYYEQAPAFMKKLRQTCFPHISPLDKLKLDLEELWVAGACIENIHGRTMLAGIGRVFEDGFELPPHQDILQRDISEAAQPPIHSYENLVTQLSANIYLHIPEVGGELEIWDLQPSNVNQQAIPNSEYQYEGFVSRAHLSTPTVIIKPEIGELILLDSKRIHAVSASSGSPRVSMSMFIGYRGQDKPLTYWS